MGASLLRTGVTMLCVLNDVSIHRSIAIGLLPWLAYILQNIVFELPHKFGGEEHPIFIIVLCD
jgi:hypothetical protein